MKITTESIVRDYRVMFQSRQASLLGRKEVFTGKAKFGIFGDGKEVAQLAMARAFRKGDVRSGYYRDQTFMLALGMRPINILGQIVLESLLLLAIGLALGSALAWAAVEPIKDGVGEGWLADHVVPLVDRQLAGDQC